MLSLLNDWIRPYLNKSNKKIKTTINKLAVNKMYFIPLYNLVIISKQLDFSL